MIRLFLYEYACAESHRTDIPDSVRREGRAMFNAILEDARQLPDIEVITVPTTQDSGLSTQHFFQKADYALIIAPEFDGILEQRARWAMEAGCQLLGPLPDAIHLTADKWKLYLHWKQRDVLTPATWLSNPAETVAGANGNPLRSTNLESLSLSCRGQLSTAPCHDTQYLTKHRFGAGSLGVNRWKPGYGVAPDHLIQEYIEGTPVSLAFLITPGGEVTPLLPCLQHIAKESHFEYRGGSLLLDARLASQLIEDASRALVGIPGLQGYVGVDAIIRGEQVYLLEINPRLTTSYLGLRQLANFNLLECMLNTIKGQPIVPLSWQPGTVSWHTGG